MAEDTPFSQNRIEIAPYDLRWPAIYRQEQDRILSVSKGQFVALEHIGSTAVPGQDAKPVIDMMGAVSSLPAVGELLTALLSIHYQIVETGMRNRLFLQKRPGDNTPAFHLHIVEWTTWEDRKERMMRDYLFSHPEAIQAYSELKKQLARQYPYDSFAYTKAKTNFVQQIIDQVRAARGLHPIDVWEE